MAESTANADQPAPPAPPTIVVEGPAGDGEAHQASSTSPSTAVAESSTYEFPDCIIASSNRYTDLRPYCDRIWAARPEYWGEVLPWDFPKTGIKDDEEVFLRQHFDQTEIHMQGGAHGAGLGFRFLGQVWWSIALYNAETRAPAIATAWWKQEEHSSWRKNPKMLAAICSRDANPETFFQPAELEMYGPNLRLQAVRHIQYQLREMEDAEGLHAPRDVSDAEAKLESAEIKTNSAATSAPRTDSLPSTADVETALSNKENAQVRVGNAQGNKAQKASVNPATGGNAGSRVNGVDYFITHVPVKHERIRVNGKTRPTSSDKGSHAGKQAYSEPQHNGPALYDPERNAFEPVQPSNPMIGRQYQQNDQNIPPMRMGSGYNAGIGASSAYASGGLQPVPLHLMGQGGFPTNQYGGYQNQNQFSQVPGGNAIYALSRQDARYYQNDVYGQQAPSVPPRYIDTATPSDFGENSSRRGGGKRHASQTSRGGGGPRNFTRGRGRAGSDRHSSYDSNFNGVRNVSMPYSDNPGPHALDKNRQPSRGADNDWWNGPVRPDYETFGAPGLGYNILPTHTQSSPRIQRYNIRTTSEDYSVGGQPYYPQAQHNADPRTPQDLLESGLLCGEKAPAPGFGITSTSIGTACRHVIDLAVFNIPPSYSDEEILMAVKTMGKVTPATISRKLGASHILEAVRRDHVFLTLHSHLDALTIFERADQLHLRGQALSVRVPKRYFDIKDRFFVKSQPDMHASGSLEAYYQWRRNQGVLPGTQGNLVSTYDASSSSIQRKPSYAIPPVPTISEADNVPLSTVHSENTTPAPSGTTTPRKSKPKKDRKANKAPREAENATKGAEAGAPQTMEAISASGSTSQVKIENASTAASEVIGVQNTEVKSSDAAKLEPRVITDTSNNNNTKQHSDTTLQSSPTAVHQPIDPYIASIDPSLAPAASTLMPVAHPALPTPATVTDTAASGTDEITSKKDVQLEDTEARKAASAEPDTIDDSFHTAQNSPPASATRNEADLTVNSEKAVQSEGMASKETSKTSLEPTPSPTPAAVRKVSGTSKRNASFSGSIPAIPKNDIKLQKSSSAGQQKSITAQDVKREATRLKPATANEEVSSVGSTEVGPVPTSTTSVPPTPSYETAPSTPAFPDTQTTAADVKKSKNEARSNANMAKMVTTHDNVKKPDVEKTALVKPSAVAEKTDVVNQTADVEKITVEKVVADGTVGEEVTAAEAAVEKAAVEKAAVEKAAVEKAAVEKAVVEKAAVEKAVVEKAAAAEKRKGPSQTESLSMFGKKIKPAKQKKPAKGKASIRGKPAELSVDVDLANSREAAHASIASTPTLKGDDSPEQAKTNAAKETKEVESSSTNKQGKKATATNTGGAKGQDASAPSASNLPRKQSIAADLADNVGKYLGLGSFLSKGKSATNVDFGTSAASPLPTKSTNAAPVAKMVAEKPASTTTAAPQVSEFSTLLQVQDFDSPSTTTKSPGQIVYTPESSPEDITMGLGVSMAGASSSGLAAAPSPAQIESIDAPPSSSKKSKKKKKSKGKGKAKATAQLEPTVDDTDAEDEPLPKGFALNDNTDWTQLDRDVALFVTRSYSTDEGSASTLVRKPSKSAGEKAREAIAARSASSSGANVVTAPHPRNLRLKRATRNESPNSASSTSSSEPARAASPPPVKQPDRARLLREQNKYLILVGADPVKLKRQQELQEAKLSIPGFGDHSRINAIDDEVAHRGPEERKKFHDAMWAIEKPWEGSSSESMDSEDEAVARVLGEIQEKGRVLGEVSEGDEE